MTVGELIEVLEQYPKDVEVLVDCRNISEACFDLIEDFYADGSASVNIET